MSALVPIVLLADQTEGTQATVAQWLKQPGDSVQKDEPLIELETDKVMMEVTAPADGVLQEIKLQPGDAVAPEQVLGTISAGEVSKPLNAMQQAEHSSLTPKEKNHEVIEKPTAGASNPPSVTVISPAVRRLTREHNLDLSQLKGSGKNGRITTRDIQAYLKGNSTLKTPASAAENSEMIPHTVMRQRIAEHMQHSVQTAPHVTSVFDMDLSRIIAHRKQHKENFAQRGAKLTFTAYFIAATVQAMQTEPKINSRFHQDALEVFKYMHIGIGTALGDEGLIVPVIKHCEQMDLFQIATGLTEITNKARDNKLTQQDVQGGTFTISNHGVSGSLVATPIIINQPQTAILGLGKMEKRVVVRDIGGEDAMLIKPMCYVSLTIDHRALDAFQTNRFLTAFVETIENWS
ncbi:dihydrolipoamide acetyltransferase family protein [Marinicella sp. W31]|uniref:dihydrolipoamide acetyltransferase family protein n=1 Tax=Marinicella sp. W31 TaxID=3023713 RepID=UPI0037562DEF